MIKTENNCLEITKKIPDSNMKGQVFNQSQYSHKITYCPDRFHKPNFETQAFIVDWQLLVDDPFDGEILWY